MNINSNKQRDKHLSLKGKTGFNALKYILVVLFAAVFTNANGQIIFQKLITGNFNWLGTIKQDSKSNYYYAGTNNGKGFIQKLTPIGQLYQGKTYNADHYYDEVIDPEDNVVAVGSFNSQFIVNSLGLGTGSAFNNEYTSATTTSDVANSIDYTVNSSTGVFDGYIVGGQRNGYPYLVKIDKSGNVVWEKELEYNPTGLSVNQGNILCVKRTYDKGYITVAAVSSASSSILVTKFNSAMTVSWSELYSLSASGVFDNPAKIIQTDDDGDGNKDNGYAILSTDASVNKSELLKIQSNGTVSWTYDINSYPPWSNFHTFSICQDNNGYLAIAGGSPCYMAKIRFLTTTSPITVTTPTVVSAKEYTQYAATGSELLSVAPTTDGGFIFVGNQSGVGGNSKCYLVKTDQNGNSGGTPCSKQNNITTSTLTSVSISTASAALMVGVPSYPSFINNSVTLGATSVTDTISAVCSDSCESNPTASLSGYHCDSTTDTLRLITTYPGTLIKWYHNGIVIDSSGVTKKNYAGGAYSVQVSYGSCKYMTDTFEQFNLVLNSTGTISAQVEDSVYLTTCPGHSCSQCTNPYIVVDTNAIGLVNKVQYKWYHIVGGVKMDVSPTINPWQKLINDTGAYEVDINYRHGLCPDVYHFGAKYVKPTISGGSLCDLNHKIDRFGSKNTTLKANPHMIIGSGHYYYHWYYASLNPARPHGFTRISVSDSTDSLINCKPGKYYVEFTDDSNRCYSYPSDTLTYTSPDTGIHANFDFDKIHCVGGHAATIVCQNETPPSIYGTTVMQPIFYTWKVNGVTKEIDFSNSDFSYYPIHRGDTITLEVTDSGYCIHSISKIVTDTPFTVAPTVSAFDGYYNGSSWVSTSSYGSLPCGRKHQIRVTGTHLDDMTEFGYLPAANAVFSDSIVRNNPDSFEIIYTLDSNFVGAIKFYVANSSCLKDTSTVNINYILTTAYDRQSKGNSPSGQDLYISEGTPAFDLIAGNYKVMGLPSGVLSPATTKIFKSGVLHNPGTTTAGILYSLHPTATFPDNMFNTLSDSVTSDTSRNKTYDIDVYFHHSSAAGPPTECDSKPDRLHVHVFRPIVTVTNTRYCAGSSSTTATITIKNIPDSLFLFGGVDVYITLYDAANNKLNSIPLHYNTDNKDSIWFTYTIPTTYGDSFYVEIKDSLPSWFKIPSGIIKKPYRLTGSYLAHTIDFQQLINGHYVSVSAGDTVCISGGQFPDIKTLITPRSESLSGGTYTYQWYDAHGTAIAGDSGRIHNHLCDTFSLPIFHAASSVAASYTYPFHVVVTELAGSGTLCSGASGTGHGCAVSKTLNYIDNTPQGVSITQASAYFCGSTMQLYATYNSQYSYKWQELVNGTWADSFNHSGNSHRDTLTINHVGTYRCIITKTKPSYASCPVTSNALTITAPVLTIIDPTNAFVVGTSNLDVDPSISSYFASPYQWYYISATGSAPTAVSGGINNSLSPSNAGYYYLKASLTTCGSGTVYSNMLYIASSTCTSSGPGIPTSTTTASGSYFANASYTVAPGRTISIGNTSSASTIVMAANTYIEVPNGTSLTLINCNISCCAGMWKGIDVQGSGTLTLTNCTINNAAIAAYSENGGSLTVTGCKFLNNVNHIAISDCTGKLSANISGNTFGNLVNMPSLGSTSFFTTLNNSNYGKMIYVNNVPNGFATGGSISSNRFDNYIPEANGWYASGIEFYNADTININTDSFGISGPNFDRGVYAENGTGITGDLNFTADIFMGSSSSKTFRTGFVLNNVQNCGIGGSVGSHNVFKYLVNGIEYYQANPISLANSITYADFENNTYGFVGAPGSHPVLTGSNNYLTTTLNVNIHCNKFINNDFGIIGSGNLIAQGSSGGTDAGNNFNKPTPSTSCNPGTPCPSLNSKADILWVTPASTPTFYYYAPLYGYPGTITTSMSSGSTAFNGSTVSSSSSGILGTSGMNAGCYGSFKRDETSLGQTEDSIATLNVYPNPSYNYFTVQLPKAGETMHYIMQVTDITGRRMYRCSAGSKPNEIIDASTWASGAYFVTLVSETGKLYNVKIVKQQ